MNGDMFDNGTPKYQSPQDIYDGLCAMETGEEIGILGQMFADVSWDNQDYYYTDAGGRLREKWDELTGYDDEWKMELAVWQVDGGETQDIIWLCLNNDDAAKAIGFKKIFVDELLAGFKSQYEISADAYRDRLAELRGWSYYDFLTEWASTWKELNPTGYMMQNPYGNFAGRLYKKAIGLKLEAERKLIVEARAMLNAYDDFMFGLKSNQYLYDQQSKMYQNKVAQLQRKYDMAVKALMQAAQEQGVTITLPGALLELTEGDKTHD